MKYRTYIVRAKDYEADDTERVSATSEEDAIDKFKSEYGREILNNLRYEVEEEEEEE